MLQVCLNGSRRKTVHPAVPHTPTELARDVHALFEAGARSFHLHVYDESGRESLNARSVADTLHAIRQSCPEAEIAISTAEGIASTPEERVHLISEWTIWPDTLCVNLAEDGIEAVLALAEAREQALEAGLFRPVEVRQLKTLPNLNWRRLLLEPLSPIPAAAEAELQALLDELGNFRSELPRLAHGMDGATWPILRRAAALGLGSRIGFEDVLTLPDGQRPDGNLDLYLAGRDLMHREQT